MYSEQEIKNFKPSSHTKISPVKEKNDVVLKKRENINSSFNLACLSQPSVRFHEFYRVSSKDLQADYSNFTPKFAKMNINKEKFEKTTETAPIKHIKIDENTPKAHSPILTKTGYKTTPSLSTLQAMSIEEIKNVNNFSIENQYGIISYKTFTNLTGLNLDQTVTIEKGMVSLFKSNNTYTPVGKGLNKPAIITLFDCKPKKPVPYDEFVKVLRALCETNKAKFIDWNKKTGEWKYSVENFEIYK